MKTWETWEIELLEVYKQQATTTEIIAKLLGRKKEEVEEKLEELRAKY